MNNFDLPEWSIPIVIITALWTLFWKGVALWHAARKDNRPWFYALLLVNTLGILEIIYIFGIAKIKTDKLFK